MKRVELAVSVASAEDFDISATAIVVLTVPDHFSAGHACREALRLLSEAGAARTGDDDE